MVRDAVAHLRERRRAEGHFQRQDDTRLHQDFRLAVRRRRHEGYRRQHRGGGRGLLRPLGRRDGSRPRRTISLKGSDIPHAKDWNTSINNTVLKSGKKASFYSSVWDLTLQYNSATKNGKEVSWYAWGVKGTTAIKRDRYITKEEFISFVQPNRDMIISGQKKADFLLEGGQQQAQLPAPSDIPF